MGLLKGKVRIRVSVRNAFGATYILSRGHFLVRVGKWSRRRDEEKIGGFRWKRKLCMKATRQGYGTIINIQN